MNITIHVDTPGGGPSVSSPGISYMMMRSIVLNSHKEGRHLTFLKGPENTPVDPDEYLETLRQSAIAAVKAQVAVDKTA